MAIAGAHSLTHCEAEMSEPARIDAIAASSGMKRCVRRRYHRGGRVPTPKSTTTTPAFRTSLSKTCGRSKSSDFFSSKIGAATPRGCAGTLSLYRPDVEDRGRRRERMSPLSEGFARADRGAEAWIRRCRLLNMLGDIGEFANRNAFMANDRIVFAIAPNRTLLVGVRRRRGVDLSRAGDGRRRAAAGTDLQGGAGAPSRIRA